VGRHHHPVDRASVGRRPVHVSPAGSGGAGVHRPPVGAGSVGTVFEGPGAARITLRGDLDAAALGRLEADLEGCLTFHIRFITIDATAVSSAGPQIVEVLGRAEHQLVPRRGTLSVLGLHPHMLRTGPDERGAQPSDTAPR
jgi:anti-anti-sigma regulatory factor